MTAVALRENERTAMVRTGDTDDRLVGVADARSSVDIPAQYNVQRDRSTNTDRY